MPAETTWLDVVTLAIAVIGLTLAVGSIVLGIRTDRRQSQTVLSVEVLVGSNDLLLHVTNVAQRRVTAQRTGFAQSKRADRSTSFTGWYDMDGRVPGRFGAEAAFPKTLEPGGPTYEARAPLHIVKGELFPEVPKWAWCEDERRNAYWARVSEVMRDAIRSTKRRVPGPVDEYGQPAEIEIDDGE